MLQPRFVLACALLLAACGKVDHSDDAAPGDHRDDGGDTVIIDAGAPDATPVACDGPEDCMNPDDPCLLPGPCEESVCHFEAVDCTELDDECTRGVCNEAGSCEPRAIREDMACGDGVMDCGGYGACGYTDMCDEAATQSRSCTDSTCQSGSCVTSAPYTDTRECARETDGISCDDTTTSCGNCAYSSTCDRDGSPITCTDTVYTCEGGACDPDVGGPYTMDVCHRDTECNPCTPTGGGVGTCTVGGACNPGPCQ